LRAPQIINSQSRKNKLEDRKKMLIIRKWGKIGKRRGTRGKPPKKEALRP